MSTGFSPERLKCWAHDWRLFDVRLSILGQRTLFFFIGFVVIRYSTVQHPHKCYQSPLSHNPRPRGPEATLRCKSDHVTWRRESDRWTQWLGWGLRYGIARPVLAECVPCHGYTCSLGLVIWMKWLICQDGSCLVFADCLTALYASRCSETAVFWR